MAPAYSSFADTSDHSSIYGVTEMKLAVLVRGWQECKVTRKTASLLEAAPCHWDHWRGEDLTLSTYMKLASCRARRAARSLPVTETFLQQIRSAGGQRWPVQSLQTWKRTVLSRQNENLSCFWIHRLLRMQLKRRQICWRECCATEAVEV